MPNVEENKTVDIDTSGPGAEIELKKKKMNQKLILEHQVKKKRNNLPRTKRLKTNVRLN